MSLVTHFSTGISYLIAFKTKFLKELGFDVEGVIRLWGQDFEQHWVVVVVVVVVVLSPRSFEQTPRLKKSSRRNMKQDLLIFLSKNMLLINLLLVLKMIKRLYDTLYNILSQTKQPLAQINKKIAQVIPKHFFSPENCLEVFRMFWVLTLLYLFFRNLKWFLRFKD